MTDHYAEAERLLRESHRPSYKDALKDRLVARAHVHAMLAAIPRPQLPVMVKAPQELLDSMRKLDLPLGAGILLVPEEIAAGFAHGDDEAGLQNFIDALHEAMRAPVNEGD
jgi:hypothetical protein